MNKRRKLKSSVKIVLLVSVVVFCIILFKDSDDILEVIHHDNDVSIEVDYEITDKSESDSHIIKNKFADGMSVDKFKEVFNRKINIIKENGKYELIDYDFDNKLHYSDLEKLYLNMNNLDIVDVMVIGKSVDNRNIYGIEVGKGKDVIFIDANVHAAEVANTLILTKFLSDILNDYSLGDKDTINMLNNVKLAIIPSINPDGYEIYNYGIESLNNKDLWIYKNKDNINFDNIKSNANGIDISRNFPTQNAGLQYNGKSLLNSVSLKETYKRGVYFGGYELGSEPETKAVMWFMYKHYKNTVKYINMHSQGRVMYAGKPNLSDEFNDITSKFAKDISKINGYTVYGLSSEEVGQGNDGSATDFMAELANGFVFSSVTGRLSTDKYIDNSCELIYSYPVITLETIKTYSTDPSLFKKEYYDYNLKDMLYSFIK